MRASENFRAGAALPGQDSKRKRADLGEGCYFLAVVRNGIDANRFMGLCHLLTELLPSLGECGNSRSYRPRDDNRRLRGIDSPYSLARSTPEEVSKHT